MGTDGEMACSSFCATLGISITNPGKSCQDIYQINKASRGVSADYWIQTATGTHQVYCDMELECGGHKGGWMRVADLDTSRGDDCPFGWSKMKTTTPEALDVCRVPRDIAGCYQTVYNRHGFGYTKVCGYAIESTRKELLMALKTYSNTSSICRWTLDHYRH